MRRPLSGSPLYYALYHSNPVLRRDIARGMSLAFTGPDPNDSSVCDITAGVSAIAHYLAWQWHQYCVRWHLADCGFGDLTLFVTPRAGRHYRCATLDCAHRLACFY